jgi:hypothetical protein
MVIKRILLITLCLYATGLSAQVIVDATLVKRYQQEFNKWPPKVQRQLQKENGLNYGISSGICLIEATDTLNIKDKFDYSNIKIKDISVVNGKRIKAKKTKPEKNLYAPIMCCVQLSGDTLSINSDELWGPVISNFIYKNQVSTFYKMLQEDTILRGKLSDAKVSQLKMSVPKTSCRLSTLSFKPGQLIYGEIEFVTAPYYQDSEWFKSGYIQKRDHFKYIFKTFIIDKSSPYFIPLNKLML